MAADKINRARLTIAYPDLGAIVTIYKDEDDGVQTLQDLARTVWPAPLPTGRDEWRTVARPGA